MVSLKAAEQGHADAQASLGGPVPGRQRCRPGLHRSSQNGTERLLNRETPNGQTRLGWMYLDGKGVAQDYKEAVNWYRKAAEQGNARAQNNLGLLYEKGRGVPQDYAEAMKWYRKAAEQGNDIAKRRLDTLRKRGVVE